ncbi:MAG: NAD(P)/FAD-dependent oxidoreductase [Granulicella sp.]
MAEDLRKSGSNYDVLVIGGGIAGLATARALAESGQQILLLEARDRLGGRIFTRHCDGEVIEFGAEFIHGRPPELWRLIEEAGLETYEREGESFCFEDQILRACPEGREDMVSLLEGLEDWAEPDVSFAEYLDRRSVRGEKREQIVGFVEGFNAADHQLMSVAALGRQQQAEDAIEGDRTFVLRGGYGQLTDFLAEKIAAAHGEIRLGLPVRAIHWERGHVDAKTDAGTFSANRAVITLPLGVLRANLVPIMPPPEKMPGFLEKLEMGRVRRFTLVFRERFWTDRAETLSFLFDTGGMPPVWWSQHPASSAALTGWVGGPRSDLFAGLSAEEIASQALRSLGSIFSLSEERLRSLLIACETHDWQADSYSRGAYSYVVSGGLEVSEEMSHPIETTLYFAGEHTDTTGHWGTVHAALGSGLRAARQVLADSGAPLVAGVGGVAGEDGEGAVRLFGEDDAG